MQEAIPSREGVFEIFFLKTGLVTEEVISVVSFSRMPRVEWRAFYILHSNMAKKPIFSVFERLFLNNQGSVPSEIHGHNFLNYGDHLTKFPEKVRLVT